MLQNEVELHHFDLCLFDSKSREKKKKKKNGRFSSVQTPKPHELSQLTLPSEKQTVVNVIDLTN